MQELIRKQAAAFRLPAIQDDVSGGWEAPCRIHGLCQRKFLPHNDFCIMRVFRETRQEETLVLVRTPQHCVQKLGVPSEVLCDAAWNLQRCMVPLMHLKGEDILGTSLLGAADNEHGMSLTLEEEATLLGDDAKSQEAWEITTHPPNHPEETPMPKSAARLEWTTADPRTHRSSYCDHHHQDSDCLSQYLGHISLKM